MSYFSLVNETSNWQPLNILYLIPPLFLSAELLRDDWMNFLEISVMIENDNTSSHLFFSNFISCHRFPIPRHKLCLNEISETVDLNNQTFWNHRPLYVNFFELFCLSRPYFWSFFIIKPHICHLCTLKWTKHCTSEEISRVAFFF